jgi:hypothetical protein
MKKLIIILLLLPNISQASPKNIIIPTLYYSALQFGDWKSSKDAIARGGTEANVTVSTIGITPAKIVGTIAMTTADLLLQKNKKNRPALWVYRISMGVIYGFVIIHNSEVHK